MLGRDAENLELRLVAVTTLTPKVKEKYVILYFGSLTCSMQGLDNLDNSQYYVFF